MALAAAAFGRQASWQTVAVHVWLEFNIVSFMWFHIDEYRRVAHIYAVANYAIIASDNVDAMLLSKQMLEYQ